jgi:alpha-glucosidase/alpha-D-xyloside xylohydrolase
MDPSVTKTTAKAGTASRRDFLYGACAATLGNLVASSIAGNGPLVSASEETTPHALILTGIEVKLFFTPISENTLRISVLPTSSEAQPEQAFAANGLQDHLRMSLPECNVHHMTADFVPCGKFSVRATGNPLTISIAEAGVERQRLRFDRDTGRVSFDLHGQPVFGLGEGGHQFDRRGVADAMRNGQFKPDQFLNGGRLPIPWLISPAGWGLFFHHPAGTFDLTGTEGVFRPAAAPEAQDIFLIVHRDPAVVLREFAKLSGFPQLPPLWALG